METDQIELLMAKFPVQLGRVDTRQTMVPVGPKLFVESRERLCCGLRLLGALQPMMDSCVCKCIGL